ncbi:HalOD1 output domain-containing protein [Halorubrum sp. Atlit-26R]|uniref:HalOD1 output domain-containing protein n=1 Tax=Halorubrum sp. Atlit-26R TaxID=2282128 RepID=UPI003742F960
MSIRRLSGRDLYGVLDPDALFQHGSGESKSDIAVSFELDGSDVMVYSTGEVVASMSNGGGGG